MTTTRLHQPAACLAVCWMVFGASTALAQPPRLLDREPFDQIVLSEAAGGAVLDVFRLELPRRPLPTLPQQGSITVRLLARPTEEFQIAWRDVAELRLHERLLFEEAQRLTAADEFDEAFDYFAYLQARYPGLPGLGEAVNGYLRRNALALYDANQHDRALAVLLSLAARDPKSPGLAGAVETMAGELIQQHLRRQDYAAARAVLGLWRSEFPEGGAAAAENWQRRFETAARRQLDEANALMQQKQYVEARSAAGRALRIWPELEEAAALTARIQREFPFVTVGVFETSPDQPHHRIDNWAALRTSRLVEPLLVEQFGFSPDGGLYRSPYGELIPDESGLRLSLKLTAAEDGEGRLAIDRLARYLLEMADPHSPVYRSDVAALLAGISITPDRVLQLDWMRPHVRPEALLKVPLPPSDESRAYGAGGPSASTWPRFARTSASGESVLFTTNESAAPSLPGPRMIVEQTFADDEAAVAALIAGDIDVLDRVPPWHLERLRSVRDIRVESYRLPTVHVLVPNMSRPLMARREFRRGLCFGIQREGIVRRVLLGGAELPGFQVVSGPFPAGLSLGDPIRYAYNNQLSPRPFEPRLAAILTMVAWSSVLDPEGTGDVELTDLPDLVLAHPSDPLARLACQTIEQQLGRAGIRVKLLECSADDLAAGRVEYDLRYAELAAWEPLVDARRILGANGLVDGFDSPYLDAAFRRLDEAANWRDVRARMAEIHEIAYHDLPVVPLWQTVNYFAYRTAMRGIGEAPVVLYQDVDRWTTAAAESIARHD